MRWCTAYSALEGIKGNAQYDSTSRWCFQGVISRVGIPPNPVLLCQGQKNLSESSFPDVHRNSKQEGTHCHAFIKSRDVEGPGCLVNRFSHLVASVTNPFTNLGVSEKMG